MSYETFKIGKMKRQPSITRYTREELEQFEIPRLREICRAQQIKPPTVRTMEEKESLVEMLFNHLGVVQKPLIRRYEEESALRLEERIRERGKEREDGEVELPLRMKIYQGLHSLDEDDTEYVVTATHPIDPSYALLVDADGGIQAILTVHPMDKKQSYRLRLHRERTAPTLPLGSIWDMSLLFFPNGRGEEVVRAYQGQSRNQSAIPYFKASVPEVWVVDVPETNEVLVIDYGTSFTTAGTYSQPEGCERIRFAPSDRCGRCRKEESSKTGMTCEGSGFCELCPSVVAVHSCERDRIDFLFGQEAIQEVSQKGFMAKNSVFYDTKRWVNCYRENVLVSDGEGRVREVERLQIIRAFLLFVIHTAEQQNKTRYRRIYLTCPVKQRSRSLKMYRDALSDYEVLGRDVLDEAMAVVYHSIAGSIERLGYEKESKQVLVLDCGGGTSDMAACKFTVSNGSITSKLDMSVRYAQGDTNFGGNNLTYRILQYIKIRLAEHYGGVPVVPLERLMGGAMDAYSFVDERGVEAAYEALEERYGWAEGVLPTGFLKYPSATESDALKIKGNLYSLWHLSEDIKKEMFDPAGVVWVPLSRFFNNTEGVFEMVEGFRLSVRGPQGELETHTVCPDIQIAKEEIHLLLKPEMYQLIKKFLEPYYNDGSLDEIDHVFLSGQTTKIELFREVLKEFMEGRRAKVGRESSCLKKFICLEGATAYQEAKKIGRLRPSLTYESAFIPYELTVTQFQPEKREKTLIRNGQALCDVYGWISRPIETEEVVFTLKDSNGNTRSQLVYAVRIKEYQETEYEFLSGEPPANRILQEDVDNIEEGEVKLFVLAEEDDWGFQVVGVARSKGKLMYREPCYFPFETSDWETNFFDGYH